MSLPDPALVVLVGASGSGKSTWAAQRYRAQEVVSSDALRGVVGSGPHDLDASDDAFALLETVVAARLGRRLTTVVDTLGFDAGRRRGWLARARRGRPARGRSCCSTPPTPSAVAATPQRDRPVPARVLAGQLRKCAGRSGRARGRGLGPRRPGRRRRRPAAAPPAPAAAPAGGDRTASTGVEVLLQVSRFPWGEDPLAWLRGVALAADEAGFAGLALMDHLIQIPQVGRAWDPIPEPWVTLGALAALGTGLRLGTLCTPVTFRPPGITAKAAATLSALTGGRAFVGIGAGWWEREHAAYGLPFPPARSGSTSSSARSRHAGAVGAGHQGVRRPTGSRCPRPPATRGPPPPVPVIVGGGGERRTLRIAAELGDACNLTTSDPQVLRHKVDVLRDALRRRRPRPGRGRGHGARPARRRPRPRRRLAPGGAAPRPHRGRGVRGPHPRRHGGRAPRPVRRRWRELGVSTVFLSTRDLDGPDAVLDLAGLNA